MQLCLPVHTKIVGKWRIASCPLLDLHAQGHTKREAIANLEAILFDVFVSCLERQTLDEVLSGAGLTPLSGALAHATPEKGERHEHITVRVPLVAARSRSSDCETVTA